MGNFTSDLSGKEFPASQRVPAHTIRQGILNKIKEDYPKFPENGNLSSSELNEYRNRYVESCLREEMDSISHLEQAVLTALHNNQFISDNIDESYSEKLTLSQRIADRIASFGGSWIFIISFFAFLALWMAVNTVISVLKPFDPFPFILLNLILSCLAALQAPVIMMSQKRLEEKDRLRSKHDYQVNLKAELEIRMLHEKVDHIILVQQQRLLEMQEIQVEMLKEINEKLDGVN